MNSKSRGRDHVTGRGAVLLVGINYWPEHTGIAPYTTDLAEHLASRGYLVTVLTGMPHYPSWQVAEAYRGRLWVSELINGVRVERRWHYVPHRPSAWRRAVFEATFFAAGLSAGWSTKPLLVVGVVPSLSGGLLAALFARRYGVPYGLIFQDLMGQAAIQSGVAGGVKVARGTRALEGWIARSAARVAVISDGFRGYLEALGVREDRIVLLPNWTHIRPPRRDRLEVRQELGWDNGEQVVLHAGNMGVKQGLEHVVAAARLAAARALPVRFVLMGDGNQRPWLVSLARDLPKVTFLEPQPDDRFPDVLAAADVLLVHQRRSVLDMALPSKLTSYFAAGRPVVAAAVAGGTTAREIERSGAGLLIPPEDPEALLDALQRLAADRSLSARLAAAGPEYMTRHLSRAAALGQSEEFIEQVASAGASSPRGELEAEQLP